MESPELGSLFLERARFHLMTEYRTKLRCAVEALPEEQVWWRPNEASNSVGNLLLHLSGNVRQWIVDGIAGTPDSRNRAAEFAAREGASGGELIAGIERVLVEADRVLAGLGPEALLERRVIQGRDVAVLEAIFTVVQHFSQHLGQIIWVAKIHAPESIAFVKEVDGVARPLWLDQVRPPVGPSA